MITWWNHFIVLNILLPLPMWDNKRPILFHFYFVSQELFEVSCLMCWDVIRLHVLACGEVLWAGMWGGFMGWHVSRLYVLACEEALCTGTWEGFKCLHVRKLDMLPCEEASHPNTRGGFLCWHVSPLHIPARAVYLEIHWEMANFNVRFLAIFFSFTFKHIFCKT